MLQTREFEGVSTVVSASSSCCDEIYISVWVHKMRKSDTVASRDKLWTLGSFLQMVINVGVVVAILAFIYRSFVGVSVGHNVRLGVC